MGLFVQIQIDQGKLTTLEARQRLAAVCPVDALLPAEDALRVSADREDECTFCDLCIRQAPRGAIRIVKTYQEFLSRK